jgi:hypothetical protein
MKNVKPEIYASNILKNPFLSHKKLRPHVKGQTDNIVSKLQKFVLRSMRNT